MYERDPNINFLPDIERDNIIYGDFMQQIITKNTKQLLVILHI